MNEEVNEGVGAGAINPEISGRVQEPFLNDLRKTRKRVQIYLRSGIRLEGRLISFDPHMLQLDSGEMQAIYKHQIATIGVAPARPMRRAGPSSGPRAGAPVKRDVKVVRRTSRLRPDSSGSE